MSMEKQKTKKIIPALDSAKLPRAYPKNKKRGKKLELDKEYFGFHNEKDTKGVDEWGF